MRGAGLLGSVRQVGEGSWLAALDGQAEGGGDGPVRIRGPHRLPSRPVRPRRGPIPRRAALLRHLLISAGVPVNDVARIMGHEHMSTTLDRYTHSTNDRFGRVRDVFVADPLPE